MTDAIRVKSLDDAVAALLSHVWLGGNENPESVAVSSFMPPADTNIMRAMEELRTAYFARRVGECVEVGPIKALQARCDMLEAQRDAAWGAFDVERKEFAKLAGQHKKLEAAARDALSLLADYVETDSPLPTQRSARVIRKLRSALDGGE